ncbi:MAG TPA: D-alanyl-D-alanine carboxypeptidase family protein [Xanthobacteraceae bacterium]|jgi:D-alanyl-D-alanine carboxypeptidase|nr:D-alanyl-D-alanine carboxypeptidase family protein [Xanthobacteraceae bacterium]
MPVPSFFRAKVWLLAAATAAAATLAQPRFAAAEALLLVDAESGKVLFAENATRPWYPASLTKLMTAYVTLHAIKDGRVTPDKLLIVSANAMAQQPSKMGFKVGIKLTVDNALKMMIVKSANDMAVVLAEGVAGSVPAFAAEMNRAAQGLGMTQTHFVNPNGLPDEDQVTSARDLAILTRALIREFPDYAVYWHISSLKFGRRLIRNHNPLIDRYPGADGMKTGFTCASGLNLVATVTRGDRRLIAVVLGAPTSAIRTEKALELFERGFNANPVSWFTPSLGSVNALQPVNMPPPDLHEEVCGKNRHHTETAEEEPPSTADPDRTPGLSALLPPFGTGAGKPSIPVLGPPVPSMAPIVVFVGPPKKPGNPETAVAKGEPRHAKRAKATKPALAAKSTTPSPAPAHRKKPAPAAAAAAPAAAPAPAAPAPPAAAPSTNLFNPAPTIAPAAPAGR